MGPVRSRGIISLKSTITGAIPILVGDEWDGVQHQRGRPKASLVDLPEKNACIPDGIEKVFYGSRGDVQYSSCRPGVVAPIYFEVIERPRAAPTAADTGVEDRVGAALRL